MAEVKVAEMRILERQKIARMGNRRATPQFGRPFPVAVKPSARRGNVCSLAVVGSCRQRFGRLHALDELRLKGLVGCGGQSAGAKGMRHGEIGIIRDDSVDLGQWIGLVRMQQIDRMIERIDRLLSAK